jgi:hypothetical protein
MTLEFIDLCPEVVEMTAQQWGLEAIPCQPTPLAWDAQTAALGPRLGDTLWGRREL